jgi:NADH-quinone oxidoreductase subunit G
VRFSQEISEDYQLVLQERGADTFVATFDGHPYVAPFSGNIVELCPVGALTSQPYRFRARPWDIEGAGSVCTLCPGQCNVQLTVRDERVLRVNARDHDEVDDGWLCDRGRFAYQSIHVDERITQPMLRDGGTLAPVTWERALEAAASALGRMKGRVGALAGDGTTNEEGFLLQRLMREGLGSPHMDSRLGGRLPRGLLAALGDPVLQATVPDLEFAHAVLVLDCEPVDDMPIVDLRIRKGVRRRGVKLAVASSRPSSLDPNAAAVARFAPGAGEAFVAALSAALGGGGVVGELAEAAGTTAEAVEAVAAVLRDAGEDVVVVWGERLTHGARGVHAARALLNAAGRIVTPDHAGSGLLEIPSSSNGRGLREAGFLPTAGPGLGEVAEGHDAAGIAAAAASGELTALYLLHVDPLRSLPGRALWEEALDKATTVIAHASFLTEGIREHATVVFPAEAYAEKEGTLTHPDGRLQRVRSAIAHPGGVRPEWQVIADLSARVGLEGRTLTAGQAFLQLAAQVPFYATITLDEIGGRGVRWPERNAPLWPRGDQGPFGLEMPPHAPTPNGALRLGTYRSIWASPEVEVSPALKFLAGRQVVELHPDDAARLGVGHGDRVAVGADGRRVVGRAHLRSDAPAGTAFLQTGIPEDSAAAFDGDGLVEVTRA